MTSPSPIGHRTVTADLVATFAALTGDYSRIHIDHALGNASPHGSGIAHGLLSASWALGALTLGAPESVGVGRRDAFVSDFSVRFQKVVRFGDTLSLTANAQGAETTFELANQDEVVVGRGSVETSDDRSRSAGVSAPDDAAQSYGPTGISSVRTITEADVVSYVGFSGELNPLYLDAEFAREGPFGERVAPPMLCFCLGFGVWLREFLRGRTSRRESGAGHLGDRWTALAPVRIGDTLRVAYRPVSVRASRTQPGRGIVTFGLDLQNQHDEVVLRGESDFLLDLNP